MKTKLNGDKKMNKTNMFISFIVSVVVGFFILRLIIGDVNPGGIAGLIVGSAAFTILFNKI